MAGQSDLTLDTIDMSMLYDQIKDIRNTQDLQLFFSERAKKYHEYHLRRKRLRKIQLYIFYLFMLLHSLVIVILLYLFFYPMFITGTICLIATTVAYFSIYLIRVNIINNPDVSENDQGLVIWYLCCLRVG